MRQNTKPLASLPTEVINELSSIAFGVARRITRDRETALDIAQEVLIGSMDHWLDEPVKLKAYIVRSAMNRAPFEEGASSSTAPTTVRRTPGAGSTRRTASKKAASGPLASTAPRP